MLGVDHDKIILLSTPFQPSQCWEQIVGVMLFCSMLGNKRCCIVNLYCIVLYYIRRYIYVYDNNEPRNGKQSRNIYISRAAKLSMWIYLSASLVSIVQTGYHNDHMWHHRAVLACFFYIYFKFILYAYLYCTAH